VNRYQDKELACAACGGKFVLGGREQEVYAEPPRYPQGSTLS
jgi:hypothetical protein